MLKRFFSTKVGQPALRGTLLKCTQPDMPTILAFPDLLDNPETLRPLFNKKLLEIRNVWLLNYRNSWLGDRADTMGAEEMADDVIHFMDKNHITMASVVGSGFGGRVATFAGILKYHRITSMVGLDYSPMDLTKHAAYKELKAAIELSASIDLAGKSRQEVESVLRKGVPNPRILSALRSNLTEGEGNNLFWKSGVRELARNMNLKDERANIGKFPLIGLFPGRALFFYAERSQWVHQSSNTIPIYNLFPRVRGNYGKFIDHVDTDNHHLAETEHVVSLARRIYDFYRWYDGVHPLLKDRSEIGKVAVPLRSFNDLSKEEAENLIPVGDGTIPKMIPIHRHHNWGFSPNANDIHFP